MHEVRRGIVPRSADSLQGGHELIEKVRDGPKRASVVRFLLRLRDPVERLARNAVRAVPERDSIGPRVPGRGAGCTTGARKSSSASTTSRGKPPRAALARLTTRAAWSGTSGAAAPDRHGVPPWGRAVRERPVMAQTHPG